MFDLELPEKFRRYVPLMVWLLVALVCVMIPLKIIGLGYLPADDALRHCAKAVSGKPWPEILVVGDTFKLDHNLGWHAILTAVHQATGWDAEGLVVACVVALFCLVNLPALLLLRRPEAWLAALLAAVVISDLPQRFMLGRPFILTITVLLTILLTAQTARPNWRTFLLYAGLIATSALVHGVWYLWVLPVAAFFFAGEFRRAGLMAGAWVAGVGLAALLTGHPVDYLLQAFDMAVHSVGKHATTRTIAVELQPFAGDILAVILLGGLVALRLLTRPAAPSFARNPVFWLVCGGWILGFRVSRFWEDWGWPALLVLTVMELQPLLLARFAADSLRRLLLALILAVAAFFATTNDLHSRWTQSLTWQYLTPDKPELAGWMPGHGGIFYAAEMSVFYQTFFKNPHGDWRYMVGYEPWLMPAEDFETYHRILWNAGDAKAYEPWVKKMQPADRLVIRGDGGQRPNLPQLEWNYGATGLWIGRTPRPSTP